MPELGTLLSHILLFHAGCGDDLEKTTTAYSATSTCSCCARPVSPLSVCRLSACLPAFCPPCPWLASGLPGYLPLKFSTRYSFLPHRHTLRRMSPRSLFDEARLTCVSWFNACDWLELVDVAPGNPIYRVSNEQPPDKHSRSLAVSEANLCPVVMGPYSCTSESRNRLRVKRARSGAPGKM